MTEETQPSLYDWARDRFEAEEKARLALTATVESTRTALEARMNERFSHLEQLFSTVQTWANRAVDKAEKAQELHNIAQNDWKTLVQDFRANTVTRTELERESRIDFGRYAGWAVAVLIALIEAASRMVK